MASKRFSRHYERYIEIHDIIQKLSYRNDVGYIREIPFFDFEFSSKGQITGLIPKGLLSFLLMGEKVAGEQIMNNVVVTAILLWESYDIETIIELEIEKAKRQMDNKKHELMSKTMGVK